MFSNGLSPLLPPARGCMSAMPSHVSLELRTSSSSWLGSCLDLPTALDAAVAALPAAAPVAALAAEDSHFVSGGGGGAEAVAAVGALTGRVAAALAGCGELRLREVRRMPVWRQQVGWWRVGCGAWGVGRGASRCGGGRGVGAVEQAGVGHGLGLGAETVGNRYACQQAQMRACTCWGLW